MDRKDEMAENEADRYYSWKLQRELTWGVVVLACLTGLIELIPVISRGLHILFLVSASLIYFGLAIILSYSMMFLSKLFQYDLKGLSAGSAKFLKELEGLHFHILTIPKVMKFLSAVTLLLWILMWLSKML